MIEKSKNSKVPLKEFLALLAIIISFTGSGVVLFSVAGFSVTAMRLVGIFCLVYSFVVFVKKTTTERYNVVLVLLGGYMMLVTIMFSPNVITGITIMMDYLICIAVFRMVVYAAKNSAVYRKCLIAFYVGLASTMAMCCYEYVTGRHIANNYSYGESVDMYQHLLSAPTAFLYNPNNVGVLMAMSIPIICLIPHFFKGFRAILITNILLVLDLAVVLMTGSRGALVASILCVVLHLLFSDFKIGTKILSVVLLGSIIVFSRSFILGQLQYGGMLENGMISIFNEGDGGRALIAKEAMDKVFKQNWLFGAGASGVENTIGMSAHAFPIEILCNYGVVGSIIFLVGIIGMLKKALRIDSVTIRKYMLMLLGMFFLVMFIPPTLMTLHFVWVLLALLLAYTEIEKRESSLDERSDVN